MSAERIFSNFPPEPNFVETISREAQSAGVSPIIHLARGLRASARESLIEKSRDLEWNLGTLVSREDGVRFASENDSEMTLIFFSHLITHLKDCVDTGTFDFNSLIANFNHDATTGTLAVPFKPKEDYGRVTLSGKEFSDLIGLHADDKSFSSILGNRDHMPPSLRKFFEEEYRMYSSPSFYEILALWKKTTKPYLNEQPATTALQATQESPEFMKPIFTPEELEKLNALRKKVENQEYR